MADFVLTASRAAGGAGIAYAFSGSDGQLLYRISNPETQASSFGFGAAELGDVNGDGTPDYQIGAPFYTDGIMARAGRSYVISGKDSAVLHTLSNPDPVSGARFGQADSDGPAVGDINGDGKADAYVDDFLSNDGSIAQAGLGYLFDGATSTLMTLQDPQAQANSTFGNSIASPGDVNGDGYPDYFIGARSANTDLGENVGLVWAFVSSPPPAVVNPIGSFSPDTVAPVVTSYRLTNNPFVASGAKTPITGLAAAKKHRRGTTFRYTLSEAATVKIVIARGRSGRRPNKRCVAPRRSLRKVAKCVRLSVQAR